MAGKKVDNIYETMLLRNKKEKVDVELNAGIINYEDKPADLVNPKLRFWLNQS
jgi:hypothetical protein